MTSNEKLKEIVDLDSTLQAPPPKTTSTPKKNKPQVPSKHYTYLLLDCTRLSELNKKQSSTDHEYFSIFVKAVFYVGKGTKKVGRNISQRSHDHFRDANGTTDNREEVSLHVLIIIMLTHILKCLLSTYNLH